MPQTGRDEARPAGEPGGTVAVLEHLSGPSLGTRTFLSADRIAIHVGDDRRFLACDCARPGFEPGGPGIRVATLIRGAGTYRLEAGDGQTVWVNGRRVDAGELVHGDIVEFGEKGPLSRFRLADTSGHSRRYFSDICADCWDYLHTSRRPPLARMGRAIGDGARRLATETTLLFRAGVIVGLVLLGVLGWQQIRLNRLQQERLAAADLQLQRFAEQLREAESEAVAPGDLDALRQALSEDLAGQLGRLESLEQMSRSAETVIGRVAGSVVYLQGAYGFRETSSGRPLRYVLGPNGRPVAGPSGQPLLTLDGDGPPAERHFTGTGFAVGDGTVLATNRHVAVPWGADEVSVPAGGGQLEPVMIRFLAFSPDWTEGAPVELLRSSEIADLSLLKLGSGGGPLRPLAIAGGTLARGGRVIVMGYPTGLRSMVARSGRTILDRLEEDEAAGYWEIAALLAENGLIQPLASSGIVAQITPDFLVYDAATTQGGSGGPVLNTAGEVIAVNAAILPGYDGSNLGIPAARLVELLNEAETALPGAEPVAPGAEETRTGRR